MKPWKNVKIASIGIDKKIRAVVKGAMEESGAVLIKRYGFDADKHAAYIQKIQKEPHLQSSNPNFFSPIIGVRFTLRLRTLHHECR